MELREALGRVPFFRCLPERAFEEISAAGRRKRLDKGELLFAENERCKELIIVLSGAVKVYNTVVLELPKASFDDLMVRYPEIAGLALKALAIRMRRLVHMVEVQALHTVRARLAAYLVRMSSGRDRFGLEETNDAIASHVGTVREVVSRTLRDLKESGVISLAGRQVIVRDPAQLRRIAGSRQEE
jgi:CRP-like cAMP-binding protein